MLLFILTACGSAGRSTSTSGKQSVQVNETDFKITSSAITFSPGTPYHFVVTNDGQTVHEFMIIPSAMGNMDKMALTKVDNIAPGQTKSLDYTFPSSTVNSHPEFACYFPGHYEVGMRLDVTVNQ